MAASAGGSRGDRAARPLYPVAHGFSDYARNAGAALCAGVLSRAAGIGRAGFFRERACGLPFHRFGVNGDAVNLRETLLYAVLLRRRHVMNLRDLQRALHCAMAGDQNVVLDLARAPI